MPVYDVFVYYIDEIDGTKVTYHKNTVTRSNIRSHDRDKDGSYE